MTFTDNDVKEFSSNDHKILGADFCSGYTDIFGKWNTGFNCPRKGNGETVYCCGTIAYKYCCTRREQQSSLGVSQPVLIGSVMGSVLVIILVTLVSCLICRRCIPYYRRAHPSFNGGPLYMMHCSSTMSGMGNIYPPSGVTTTATTPLDAPHVLMGLNNSQHHIYAQPINGLQGMVTHFSRAEDCDTPSEPPPPYIEANSREQADSECFALQTSSSQEQRSFNQSRRENDVENTENRQYWQTKF